jgi:uncharacterized RDD family membrane protein YckC
VPDTKLNPTAGLLRRVAAGVYDSLLLVALFVIPASLAIAVRGGQTVPPGDPLLQILLLLTAAAFFGWFWAHGGQTVGMRAWRLQVQNRDGTPLSLGRALTRFAFALLSLGALGLGILWIAFDRDRLAWHDRATGTHVVVLPKDRKKA